LRRCGDQNLINMHGACTEPVLLQIPLIVVSKYLETAIGPRAGNICVWLSLIIGQPLALMMYYHDFVVEHYGKELISYYGDLNKF
jgi:hypothetical protein